MNTQHTPGRLTQGRTLTTHQTMRWTPEQWAQNDEREKCMLYADFTPLDEGRGRKLVASCHQGPEDARRLAACWNACEGLSTETLERLGTIDRARVELDVIRTQAISQRDELLAVLKRMEFAFSVFAKDSTLAKLIDDARAAIAKAEGKNHG